MKFMAGFGGKDSMRDKAHKMMGMEAKTDMKVPQSYSSKGREEFRFYKNGGHVKNHALSCDQKDLKLPTRMHAPKLKTMSFEKAEDMKHGGKAHHAKHHKSFKKAALGGLMDYPENTRMELQPIRQPEGADHPTYKKGGHAKHKSHKRHYDMGGLIMPGMMPPDWLNRMKGQMPKKSMGSSAYTESDGHFKKGGHTKHKHGARMAMGGSGKIRHNQTSAKQQPLKRHEVKRDSYL